MVKEMRLQIEEMKVAILALQALVVNWQMPQAQQQQQPQQTQTPKPHKQQHPKPIPRNIFGHESYQHLISPISSSYLVSQIKEDLEFKEIFANLIQKLYFDPQHKENSTVQFVNDHFELYTGSDWKKTTNFEGVKKRVRQRINTIMQHFITTDTEEFVRSVGEYKLEELDKFTYKVDTCDDLPEFEEEINTLVQIEITRLTQ